MPDTTRTGAPARLQPVAASPVRRVLVVANQTATSSALIAALRDRVNRGAVSFRLVVPALNSRLRHWLSDTDEAVTAAQRRGEHAEAVLKSHGFSISVEIGDSVPLLAIDDAMFHFHADEILISTLPPRGSHWLEHDLVELAHDRFGIPVRHVVADDAVVAAGLTHKKKVIFSPLVTRHGA